MTIAELISRLQDYPELADVIIEYTTEYGETINLETDNVMRYNSPGSNRKAVVIFSSNYVKNAS